MERALAGVDFLASTDKWFRPVSLADGPDGALYVVDMYRQVIEHPQYMPPGLADTLDLRAGDDRGRIYRIRAKNRVATPLPPSSTDEDCVHLLSESIGWRRDLGQRLLVERKAKNAAGKVRQVLHQGAEPVTRAQALWTLDGLEQLAVEDVETALRDKDSRVQAQGARLSARYLESRPALVVALGNLAFSPDARARLEVALALGESASDEAKNVLARLASRDFHDPWISRAILTSARDRSGDLLASLTLQEDFVRGADEDKQFLVRSLAGVVGARGNRSELQGLANLFSSEETEFRWWHAAIVTGLAEGLARHQGELAPIRLAKLLDQPPVELEHLGQRIRVVLGRAVPVAENNTRWSAHERAAAISLLGYLPLEQTKGTLQGLLARPLPPEIQIAVIGALRTSAGAGAGELLLDHWSVLGPEPQRRGLDFLLEKPADTKLLLEAMEGGKVPRAVLDLERRTRVLASGNPQVKELAQRVLGAAASADRQAVLASYSSTLSKPGDAARGAQLFKRTCANCHRVRGEGHLVGPDLSDVRNKTAETLLTDVLDPNRAVDPRFVDYAVATVDGRLFTGILVQESDQSVTLRRAEGKEEVIPRNEIETLRATGRSVMPEGMEKELSVEQMADLIAFLKDSGSKLGN
ncbi:MAG: c-type cytochrome [Planctomycetota bacterium]